MMTDTGNVKNGNGLWKELFETRERTAAWVSRGLLLGISGIGVIALWLAQAQLADIKSSIDSNNKSVWAALTKLTDAENKDRNDITATSITLTNHISDDAQWDGTIRSEQADQEQRIRALEAARRAD